MSAIAMRRAARSAAVVLAVGGFVAAFAPASFAAAPVSVTCTGTTTLVTSLDSTATRVGGTGINEFRCTQSGSSEVLIGNNVMNLPPVEVDCAAPTTQPADMTISWNNGQASVLRPGGIEEVREQDNTQHAVPVLDEEGTVVSGAFAGSHYSRVVLDPADCDVVAAGKSETSQVLLTIS